MDLQNELMHHLEDSEDEMIEIRRYLHAHPEISFKEKQTAAYIKKFYRDLDCQITDYGDGYGFVVDIDSGHSGPKLGLRADFDALAIQEDNDLSFKSQVPGVMHACGHDGHTAYLMVLAKHLIALKDRLKGSIRIIHQPAEEVSPGGAQSMIADDVLKNVDNVVGIHVMSSMETGMIGYHFGETQTGRSNFTVKFTGKGGHASMPHLSNDAIVAGSYFVTALQTIVARRINPFDTASVTIGSFDGVGSYNAIKESVTLKGDVRVMKESTRKLVRKQIEQIIHGVESMFGVTAELDYDDNYPVLVNDPKLTDQVVTSLKAANLPEVTEVSDCGPQDPSEDFAYFAQKVPSCFFYVGCMTDDHANHPHHSPDFMMNEKCLLIAAKAAGTVTLNYLMHA
ncbi:amidohydrolase [Pediococcus inopinatus]|uniref:Amidohydrolase n=1 Tax=Pediococcus inopinatus TaxID=114090 RepID=A0ABZ0Q731_9LACO|nr:amidohydrolase [Pediococcus inopinatus]AVK99218.1 amidohydrolase [Pediococcus inopinatus]KRN61322.1 aminoacylase [Pediococcus inopinatus]WPC20255.1 amidohydrolase [Pediococcus inopinatus]WPC21960.1 amidohydrolase [Pediococcus inopinatus]WPP09110.1 amidohydrolase [Pediococcus inopinatus]